MENINYEDFLIKPKDNWIKKSTTNVYCNLNVLPSIVSVLKKVGELKEFRRSCFRHVVDIPHDLTFSAGVLHNLLLRQIKVPDVTGVNELHFSVGGKLLKFTQREFCLVTGLKFGEMSNIFLQPYAPIEGGIHDRYFEKDENVCLIRVWEKFMTGKFDKPKDGLKMALLLIANMVLFGRDQRKKVTLWLFELVEDLESFNSFKWGSYVYIMTCHYLCQAFRAANGPMKVIANYNLYGFPWALEIWAMEALGSLIDLVGENIGHRHPRLRNWRIFKRPHDFFSKFEKYEQKVKDGQYVILAELHPSANESEEPYLVGVDTDLSIGPQFVPDKEEEDDSQPRVDDQGDNDDNHGGQSRPQQKDKPVKRKRSLPKQKTTARTKRQRTSGDTSPVGDDSVASSQTMRELVTEMSDRFEDIVKKQISAMERRINRRLTRLEDSVTELIDARRQTTPDIHNFSTPQHQYDHNFSMPQHQDDTHVDATHSTDHLVQTHVDDTHVDDTHVDDTHVDGTHGTDQLVQTPPPLVVGTSVGDGTLQEYLAVRDERLQRVKIMSRYKSSPYTDPFQEVDKESRKLMEKYTRFKEGNNDLLLNVGTDYFAKKDFFIELESPTCWLSHEHIDAYMSLLCKQRELKADEYKSDVAVLCTDFFRKLCQEWVKFQPSEDAPLTCAFDALSYKCPDDWMLYASGDKPGWGKCWMSVKYLLVPCAVGNPDGHWILCRIDLDEQKVCIFDPLHKKKKNPSRRKQIAPLLHFMPSILQCSGYFQQKGIPPNGKLFTVQKSIGKKLPAQSDDDSCGVFISCYADILMRHKSFKMIKNVPTLRQEMALRIFANSVPAE